MVQVTINKPRLKINNTFILGLGIFMWIIGFILSFIIMSLIGIHPEQTGENWGIHHPKYLQFESLMIPSMMILMFLVVRFFYTYKIENISDNEIWLHGLEIMAAQFSLDLIILALLMGAGMGYFFSLVTILYLTIPLQFYFYAKIHI